MRFDRSIRRERSVEVDCNQLIAARDGQEIAFELFDNRTVRGVIQRVRRRGVGRRVLVGRLDENTTSGRFIIVTRGAHVAGVWRLGGEVFRLRASPGRAVVQETTGLHNGLCLSGAQHRFDAPAHPTPAGECDDGSVIDVLVGYTPAARETAGGTEAMLAEIDLAIEGTNLAYESSGVETRIQLVAAEEFAYQEEGRFSDHLHRLTNPDDGYLDAVHLHREMHQADLVTLLVQDPAACGVAWVMGIASPAFEASAFSVVHWSCAVDDFIFAHELGHNLGCDHAHPDGGNGVFEYSFGHRFVGDGGGQWRTVMAGAPGVVIPHFSNPSVFFDGQPTGVPKGRPDAADNARTINETKLIAANFRCSTTPFEGPCPIENRLLAPKPQEDARFGAAVALASNTLIVSAPETDVEDHPNSGAAYVFADVDGVWVFQQELTAPEHADHDQFGTAIAMHESWAFIGAPGDDERADDAGAVHVFISNGETWGHVQKLTSDEGTSSQNFGASIAISGSWCVIGAPGDSEFGSASGAVYVFHYEQPWWVLRQRLTSPDPGAAFRFGRAVAIKDNLLVVGSPGDSEAGDRAGSVYVYQLEADLWQLDRKLLADDADVGDEFGRSLALGETRMLIGAPFDEPSGGFSGSVYVIEIPQEPVHNLWLLSEKIFPADGATLQTFGSAVSVVEDTAVIGAGGDSEGVAGGGAAYVFDWTQSGWTQSHKVTHALIGPNAGLGQAVAFDGARAAIGAPDAQLDGAAVGAALTIDVPDTSDCDANGFPDGCDIHIDPSLDEDGNGILDQCETVPGDLNADGLVDAADLLILLGAWGACENPECPADLDGDEVIGPADLVILLGNWG